MSSIARVTIEAMHDVGIGWRTRGWFVERSVWDWVRQAPTSLVAPAAMLVGGVLLAQLVAPGVVWDLTREDGAVEMATVAVWLIAAVFFARVAVASQVKAGPAGLALLSMLIALEEISWGQRLFGVSAPDALEAINKQDEINIHNTEILHHLMRPLSLGVAGLLILGVPFLASRAGRLGVWVRRIQPPISPPGSRWLWLSATVLTLCPILVRGTYYGPFDEIGELIMATQFAVFAAVSTRRPADPRGRPGARIE